MVFPFSTSRAHRHAATFLGDYSGTLVSDGYGAYEAYVAARNGAVRHQTCWTHTRRNFWEEKDSHPVMAGEALACIATLYKIEEEIDGQPSAERLAVRQTRSRAAVDVFWDWCDRTQEDPALTPKHPIRKAIHYAVERKAKLEVFLADPDVPLDTNWVENILRPPKLGQRNWLFAWSEIGAEHIGIINGLVRQLPDAGHRTPRLADRRPAAHRHPSRRPGRRADAEAVEDAVRRQPDDLRCRSRHGGGSSCRHRKGDVIALAVAPDGDVDPFQERRKLGPRQRQRRPSRRQHRGRCESGPAPGAWPR